jgi:hypothetical protein
MTISGSALARTARVVVNAEIIEFPGATGQVEKVRSSPAEIGIAEAGEPGLVQSSARQDYGVDVGVFDARYSQVNWGVGEAVRLCGFLLVASVYVAILWLAGSTIIAVWHSY